MREDEEKTKENRRKRKRSPKKNANTYLFSSDGKRKTTDERQLSSTLDWQSGEGQQVTLYLLLKHLPPRSVAQQVQRHHTHRLIHTGLLLLLLLWPQAWEFVLGSSPPPPSHTYFCHITLIYNTSVISFFPFFFVAKFEKKLNWFSLHLTVYCFLFYFIYLFTFSNCAGDDANLNVVTLM